jgi:hypothetical protein
MHGAPLTGWWKDNGVKTTQLNPHIDEAFVRKVYSQVANILLDLTSLQFAMNALPFGADVRDGSILLHASRIQKS